MVNGCFQVIPKRCSVFQAKQDFVFRLIWRLMLGLQYSLAVLFIIYKFEGKIHPKAPGPYQSTQALRPLSGATHFLKVLRSGPQSYPMGVETSQMYCTKIFQNGEKWVLFLRKMGTQESVLLRQKGFLSGTHFPSKNLTPTPNTQVVKKKFYHHRVRIVTDYINK